MSQVECFATAPQWKVTQASHRYVTKQHEPSSNATNTADFGEAGQS